jgi:type IV pilus assembly protein PilW
MRAPRNHSRQQGLTLIELLIAMLIGLILTAGLGALTARSSASFQELQRTSMRIENARYAMALLSGELRHAGFYGHYYEMAEFAGASLPSPCATDLDTLRAAVPLSLQAYAGAATDPSGCLSGADYRAGTDVLVVRRTATPTSTPRALELNAGRVYLQTNGIGTAYVLDQARASCSVNVLVFTQKTPQPAYSADQTLPETMSCFSYDSSPDIRALSTRIYFIADCDQCENGGDGIPTLKRIALDLADGAPAFGAPESLVRGVENLRLFFGLDSDQDGEPEGDAVRASGIGGSGLDEWSQLVTAELFLLLRSEQASNGYTDSKTYVMGLDPNNDSVLPGGAYKRHLYRTHVRLNNPSDRRL